MGDNMLVLLKIIHFLSFSAGIGIGIANMVIGIRAARASGEAETALRMVQPVLGRIGLVAVILLWATGLWMWQGYADGRTDTLFLIKLGFVVILTAFSLDMERRARAAARSGPPVDPTLAKRAGPVMGLSAIAALILAVVIFS